MQRHITQIDAEPLIIDADEYRGDYYEKTTKRVGSQQDVANRWAQGKIPEKEVDTSINSRGSKRMSTKTNLVSGSRNFKGYHQPDGTGKLKHYSTIEAIRTKNLLVISNTECWARGMAHCSVPSSSIVPNGRESLPLSQWSASTDIDHSMYDIVNVESMTDWDGYDKLVEVWVPDDDEVVYYRAASEKIDTTPLEEDGIREAGAHVDAYHEN